MTNRPTYAPGSFPVLELSVSPYDVHEMFRERLPPLKLSVRSHAFPMFGAVIGFVMVDLSRGFKEPERQVSAMVDTIGLSREQVEDLVEGIVVNVKDMGKRGGFFAKPRVRVHADVVERAPEMHVGIDP